MIQDFSSYDAYLERYKMFYNEEGDERPPFLSEDQFQYHFQLLQESYQAYEELVQMGHMDEARNYYQQVINGLENILAIADASDNFSIEIT
ncbi:hypothetical protein [Thermoflavimicrobium dichotomicum]|uniref:Uncharacterized protein n=1 Tax=Thermoflavimicrobium dichotomicum TaxID=46223 RepID=A0A1I3NFY7_9BACL|nr:hypothetical protein [Thermoflavimicrobium dichotomicum]SFJ08184.1 hypothetical protein SAMN05421852_104126 [Thermoflavimicrobium dichotomicum]